jgi:hypothetical protein
MLAFVRPSYKLNVTTALSTTANARRRRSGLETSNKVSNGGPARRLPQGCRPCLRVALKRPAARRLEVERNGTGWALVGSGAARTDDGDTLD